ncbi:MAG: peptidylprolyl isomerase, partial [bacterium]
FEEAAKKYSEDPRTAENGGRLERWISESNNPIVEMFNHEFHEKFMDLDEGEITEPFTMGSDYLIVKIREKQEPKQIPFEEVKGHLKEDLKLKKHDELMAQMYQKMLDQANLVIYDQVLENLVNSKKEVNNLP